MLDKSDENLRTFNLFLTFYIVSFSTVGNNWLDVRRQCLHFESYFDKFHFHNTKFSPYFEDRNEQVSFVS